DTRLFSIYGYARLLGYDRHLNLVPDILESGEGGEGRSCTFHRRQGHRWSGGHPCTAEDLRCWREGGPHHGELSPAGPPRDLLVAGEPPKFEVLSERAVRYSWSRPNPGFLPRLAGASPLYIYRPAHYLKRFHKKYSAAVRKAEAAGTARRK